MQIQVVSKGIDVSEALREDILGRVEEGVGKYFSRPGEAYVAVSRDGPLFRVDCSVHLPSGVMLQASDTDADAYKASEGAMEKLEKRLRRYKRKLKNHHNTQKNELPAEATPIVVLQGRSDDSWEAYDASEDDDENDAVSGDEPVIVAEKPGELRALTVGMAVLELEAAGAPFMLFRNIAHNGVNVVYRRPDGNVGWIDPDRAAKG
tara:strand:+ start:3282 stop:3899 length:618 start_codon:yes stop_codon:yes gene_type:complete